MTYDPDNIEYEKATTPHDAATQAAGTINAWLQLQKPKKYVRAYCYRGHHDVTIAVIWPGHEGFRWNDRFVTLEEWQRWRHQRREGDRWCPICGRTTRMQSRGWTEHHVEI